MDIKEQIQQAYEESIQLGSLVPFLKIADQVRELDRLAVDKRDTYFNLARNVESKALSIIWEKFPLDMRRIFR